MVETKRTFASKFSQRVQKQTETVEEYAADLKKGFIPKHTSVEMSKQGKRTLCESF